MLKSQDKWIAGWGKGITGPTTPAVGGATVASALDYYSGLSYGPVRFTVISNQQQECVAILPILNGERLEDAKARAQELVDFHNQSESLTESETFRQVVKKFDATLVKALELLTILEDKLNKKENS